MAASKKAAGDAAQGQKRHVYALERSRTGTQNNSRRLPHSIIWNNDKCKHCSIKKENEVCEMIRNCFPKTGGGELRCAEGIL